LKRPIFEGSSRGGGAPKKTYGAAIGRKRFALHPARSNPADFTRAKMGMTGV
jgi:hypothetical protein